MNVSAKETLGKEEFLRLFVNQLKYQNPLKPLEGSEFASQLAQFSSLEQLYNLNKGMDQMISFQYSLNNGIATSLIGKTVKTQDDVVAKVVGISFSNGITSLLLDNNERVTLSQVKEISL